MNWFEEFKKRKMEEDEVRKRTEDLFGSGRMHMDDMTMAAMLALLAKLRSKDNAKAYEHNQQPYTKNGIQYNTWVQLIKEDEPLPDCVDPARAAIFLRQKKYPLRPDRLQWRRLETVWSSIISHLDITFYDIEEAI